MNQSDKRRHPRLKHRAKIRVLTPQQCELFIATMRDFSDSGLFLFCKDELIPEMGSILEVQTTEFEGAPIRATRVVRIEPNVGFGVEFV